MNTVKKLIKTTVKLDIDYTRLGVEFFGYKNFNMVVKDICKIDGEIDIKPSTDGSTFDLHSNVSDMFTINRKHKDGFFDSEFLMKILIYIEHLKEEYPKEFEECVKNLTQLKSIKLLLNAQILDTSEVLAKTRFTHADLRLDKVYLMAERRASRVAESPISMSS